MGISARKREGLFIEDRDLSNRSFTFPSFIYLAYVTVLLSTNKLILVHRQSVTNAA